MPKRNIEPPPSQDIEEPWQYVYAPSGLSKLFRSKRSGKWLIFRKPEEIDAVWALVREEVRAGRLGPAAKVSTAQSFKSYHAICIYTSDYDNLVDVMDLSLIHI